MNTKADDDSKTKIEILLPKILRGTVHEQFVRCGKPTCKCKNSELHGPYFYHFVRIGKKLKKRYIKQSEIEQMQAACLEGQKERQTKSNSTKRTWDLLRSMRDELRACLC